MQVINRIQVFIVFVLDFLALLFSKTVKNQQADCNKYQIQQSTIMKPPRLSFAFCYAVGS